MLLRELDSPYLAGEKQPTIEDLSMAAFCCSQHFAEARRSLESRLARLFFWFWGWRSGKKNLPEQFGKFRDYLDANLWIPETKPHGNGKGWRQIKSPFEWRLALFLMRDCHFSWKQALDCTVLEAAYMKVVAEDIDGKLDLIDDSDVQLRDAFSKAEASYTPQKIEEMFKGRN